jgi:hypothetical protein
MESQEKVELNSRNRAQMPTLGQNILRWLAVRAVNSLSLDCDYW